MHLNMNDMHVDLRVEGLRLATNTSLSQGQTIPPTTSYSLVAKQAVARGS